MKWGFDRVGITKNFALMCVNAIVKNFALKNSESFALIKNVPLFCFNENEMTSAAYMSINLSYQHQACDKQKICSRPDNML